MIPKITVSAWIPPAPSIKDEDWSRLESAGGVRLPSTSRSSIADAIKEYITNKAFYESGVRSSEVMPLLKELAKAGEQFQRALIKLHNQGNVGIAACSILRMTCVQRDVEPPSIKSMINDTINFVSVATIASKLEYTDFGRGGGDPHLLMLITALHKEYVSCGGKGRLSKTFIAFVDGALRLAGITGRSAEALKSLVREGVKSSR